MRILMITAMLLFSTAANAYDWRDTPLMNRLREISNERVLVGLQKLPANSDINKHDTLGGVVPAMQMFDLHGFSLGHRDENERRIVQRRIDAAKAWIDRGGVAQFHWHWPHPLNPKGSAWLDEHGRFEASPPFSLQQAIIDGTPENQAVIRDLEWVSQFLEQLGDREFVFRPLWEMEGGWFWWGAGTAKTGNTPEDYRAFNQFVRKWFEQRGVVDNAIWLYSMAPTVFGKGHHTNAVDIRQRCYPGGYDLIGFSIYPNGSNQWGDPDESDWQNAYSIADAVDPDLPYVISECEKLPNPDLMAEHEQKPLWAGHWYDGPNKTTTFASHPLYMGLDEWANVDDQPTSPTEPSVIVDLPESVRYDGTNPLTIELDEPLHVPFAVMFEFARHKAGVDEKTTVGICEVVRFTGPDGIRAHCDVGEPEKWAVRSRHLQDRRGQPPLFTQNGSSPAAAGWHWHVGIRHHAGMVFDTPELQAYLDDSERSIQAPHPRNHVPSGFTKIEIGRCWRWEHPITISNLVIVKGAVSKEVIAERARSLGLPYRSTRAELIADGRELGKSPVEPPLAVERGTYELTEQDGKRVLVLSAGE